jgi:hypothetical protein
MHIIALCLQQSGQLESEQLNKGSLLPELSRVGSWFFNNFVFPSLP